MAYLGLIMSLVGTAVQVQGQKDEGEARLEMANRKAEDMEEEANNVIAISQQEKEAQRKKKNLIASRALVLTAAGGGSASDVTSIKLMSDIDGEGALRESIALYRGEAESRQIRKAANIVRAGGVADFNAAQTRATATAFSAAGKMVSSYNKPKYSTKSKSGYG